MQMDMEKPQIVELAAHGVSNSLDSQLIVAKAQHCCLILK
jgi:hypothetical protein